MIPLGSAVKVKKLAIFYIENDRLPTSIEELLQQKVSNIQLDGDENQQPPINTPRNSVDYKPKDSELPEQMVAIREGKLEEIPRLPSQWEKFPNWIEKTRLALGHNN
jgi:hypothetical protein